MIARLFARSAAAKNYSATCTVNQNTTRQGLKNLADRLEALTVKTINKYCDIDKDLHLSLQKLLSNSKHGWKNFTSTHPHADLPVELLNKLIAHIENTDSVSDQLLIILLCYPQANESADQLRDNCQKALSTENEANKNITDLLFKFNKTEVLIVLEPWLRDQSVIKGDCLISQASDCLPEINARTWAAKHFINRPNEKGSSGLYNLMLCQAAASNKRGDLQAILDLSLKTESIAGSSQKNAQTSPSSEITDEESFDIIYTLEEMNTDVVLTSSRREMPNPLLISAAYDNDILCANMTKTRLYDLPLVTQQCDQIRDGKLISFDNIFHLISRNNCFKTLSTIFDLDADKCCLFKDSKAPGASADKLGTMINNENSLEKLTPLLLACDKGHLMVMIKLIKLGADPLRTDSLSQNIFHTMCLRCPRHLSILYEFLDHQLDNETNQKLINAQNYLDQTPLHIACTHVKDYAPMAVYTLVANNAKSTLKDKYGNTARHMAEQLPDSTQKTLILKIFDTEKSDFEKLDKEIREYEARLKSREEPSRKPELKNHSASDETDSASHALSISFTDSEKDLFLSRTEADSVVISPDVTGGGTDLSRSPAETDSVAISRYVTGGGINLSPSPAEPDSGITTVQGPPVNAHRPATMPADDEADYDETRTAEHRRQFLMKLQSETEAAQQEARILKDCVLDTSKSKIDRYFKGVTAQVRAELIQFSNIIDTLVQNHLEEFSRRFSDSANDNMAQFTDQFVNEQGKNGTLSLDQTVPFLNQLIQVIENTEGEASIINNFQKELAELKQQFLSRLKQFPGNVSQGGLTQGLDAYIEAEADNFRVEITILKKELIFKTINSLEWLEGDDKPSATVKDMKPINTDILDWLENQS